MASAEDMLELADQLASIAAERRDGDAQNLGNLADLYLTARNATLETVWAVQVEGRMDGLYLFRTLAVAEMFVLAVESNGGQATCTEEPLNIDVTALIAAESDGE